MSMTEVGESPAAPCQAACPAGIDVPRYMRAIREGDFEEALAVIRERLPFPSVCGYACVHPCEIKCSRIQYDEAIAIRMLKRVAAERGGDKPSIIRRMPLTGRRIAVIGSGPCGLTASHYLNILGHEVTLFESRPFPGGMLRYGIPEYRLPKEVVDREIGLIQSGGVKLVVGVAVKSVQSLLAEGFDAVLAATGAWKAILMGIAGEDNPRVIDGISFLEKINSGGSAAPGKRVIVVGGGNTAIDAARCARRLGAGVIQLYRRTRAEMPAGSEEIAEAIQEGVRIEYLAAPVRIEKSEVTCIRMELCRPDADGRPQPVPVAASEFVLGFDTLIMAVGQSAEASSVGLEGRDNGAVRVGKDGTATAMKGVFAAGDAVTGPSTIIEAIAQGRRVCETIDLYLGGKGAIPELPAGKKALRAIEPAPPGSIRPVARMIPLKRRLTTFDAVERSYGKKSAIEEAGRCFSCDLQNFDVVVDSGICKGCGYCMDACSLGVFQQSASFNPSGYKPFSANAPERCVGCLRCLYVCPDFAITVKEQ